MKGKAEDSNINIIQVIHRHHIRHPLVVILMKMMIMMMNTTQIRDTTALLLSNEVNCVKQGKDTMVIVATAVKDIHVEMEEAEKDIIPIEVEGVEEEEHPMDLRSQRWQVLLGRLA
jgi:hypothetical protein